jgi:hypothetical protein
LLAVVEAQVVMEVQPQVAQVVVLEDYCQAQQVQLLGNLFHLPLELVALVEQLELLLEFKAQVLLDLV